jgi:hypothetical protein
MRKLKINCPVKELMARRQRRMFRGWSRHVENLDEPKEMVLICEPETGKILGEENKMGPTEDLKNFQEGRDKVPYFQMGTELRSTEDIMYCQEDSQGISHCQLGNEMRSLWDLKDCQEGSGSISNYQVGRDKHSRLSKSLVDSKVISIQQGVLMKMGSVDLIVCQGSPEQIPYYQVGRDEQMRLFESLINSEVSWNQPEELTKQVSS